MSRPPRPPARRPQRRPAPAPQETAVTAPTEAPASPAGDAGNGEALFGANGCSGCHSTGSNRVVGPGLSGIGTTGESRVAGLSADQYLNDSIVSPDDFIVEGFPQGLMPGTFGETLSEQDVADLVAYLISLP
ncbi:MAG: cytochrome c [Chloroflexi bacterium]|nr:cytochrome c [Chloroflexota bacterium]